MSLSLLFRTTGAVAVLLTGLHLAVQAESSAPVPRGGGETNRLLVVAPRAWLPALEPFVAHKRSLLPAEARALEEILQRTPGSDDPEKLKRFLHAEWQARGLGYVLLAGDADVMPVRYMVLDRVTPAAFDYAFYPSDLYYADLAKPDGAFDDWNAAREGFHAGYYGEVRGEKNKQDPINFDRVDYRPEIAVGRWPVSTEEELRRVAAKTMAHERMTLAGPGEGPRRAALLAVGGWVDSRPLLDRCAAQFTTGWQVEKRYYADGEQRPGVLPPSPAEVRGLFQGGVDLVVHTGHGQPDAWEQCFSVADLDGLTNASRLPVVMSVGCSTAYFAPLPPYGAYVDVDGREHQGTDHGETFQAPPPPPAPYQRGRFNPTGLGEQMLKRGLGGAVAYLGCNTGSQPCALTLAEGFTGALARTADPRLGECWAAAVRFYFDAERLAALKPNDDWYPPSIFFQGMKFMLFGDPSLLLASSRPRTAAWDPTAAGYSGRPGTTLYVSKLGDNSDGTSWAKAFHSIQAALAAVPDNLGGHRIIVRPDTYNEANLAPAFPGAAGAYNALIGDSDGRLGSGACGWVLADAGDPDKGFKSWDWWSSFAASDRNWPTGNNRVTFSSLACDRWIFRNLYVTGGDAGLFWDLTDKSGEGFTVVVEECVGIGRAFGGGVCYPTVRDGEPSVFRRCYFLGLDWVGDTAAVLLGGWEKSMPDQPHAVFEDCTMVHPDNAVGLSYASYCARARFLRCRLIALNFTQPEMGGKSTGILCTENHRPEGRLQVDLEDCTLAGYSLFTPGKDADALRHTTQGSVRAYVQFKQPDTQGFERMGRWPTELFEHLAPPRAPEDLRTSRR